MSVRAILSGCAFGCATMLFTGQVLSGDKAEKGHQHDPGEAARECRAKAATPGEFHAHLKPLAGKWTQVVKWRLGPDEPWEEGTGTTEYKWILGGRFLQQTVVGEEKDGQRFEGLGIIGYDNVREKYTSAWMDTMGTMIMTSWGTCDVSGKVFTMKGRYKDPVTEKSKKSKSVLRIINNDKHVTEMFDEGPDEEKYKCLEITYTRK